MAEPNWFEWKQLTGQSVSIIYIRAFRCIQVSLHFNWVSEFFGFVGARPFAALPSGSNTCLFTDYPTTRHRILIDWFFCHLQISAIIFPISPGWGSLILEVSLPDHWPLQLRGPASGCLSLMIVNLLMDHDSPPCAPLAILTFAR